MKVEIQTTGPRGKVVLDGVDVSNGVQSFQLSHTAGNNLPLLVLDPLVVESKVAGEMQVYVSPKSSDVLIALGWTPPGDAS